MADICDSDYRATIANVRLWDREPLLQTFGQIQSIRTYYDFVAVDDLKVNGELTHAVDWQVVTGRSNVVTDAITGVTINLLASDAAQRTSFRCDHRGLFTVRVGCRCWRCSGSAASLRWVASRSQ